MDDDVVVRPHRRDHPWKRVVTRLSDEPGHAIREGFADARSLRVRATLPGPVLVPTLTVWCYGTPLGATAGSVRLRRLEDARALEVIDAIVVSWAPGAHRPRVTRLWPPADLSTREPSVLVALLRTALLAAHNGDPLPPDVVDRIAAAGVEPTLLDAVTARLVPRTSALLVLSGVEDLSVVVPAVRQRIVSGEVTLLRADLPSNGPELLRAAVGLEPPPIV